jgi:hypothetical protein
MAHFQKCIYSEQKRFIINMTRVRKKIIFHATLFLLFSLYRGSYADSSLELQQAGSLPEHARLFSLKLNSPLERRYDQPISKFKNMNDIVETLKKWRMYKDTVSFENLAEDWIKDNATTPEMKCMANFYRGYSFTFQYLSNLKKVKLSKAKAREQLIGFVNGQKTFNKSTFLAMRSSSGQNKIFKNETRIRQNSFDLSGNDELKPEENINFTMYNIDAPLKIMKEITGSSHTKTSTTSTTTTTTTISKSLFTNSNKRCGRDKVCTRAFI